MPLRIVLFFLFLLPPLFMFSQEKSVIRIVVFDLDPKSEDVSKDEAASFK